MSAGGPAPRDAALAAALGVAAALVYAATAQDWLFGDGPYLVTVLARARAAGEIPVWRHVLYLPLCELAWRLPGVERADQACRLVSALSGGALVAAAFLLGARGARRRSALLAAALCATSPAAWFFATTVELHALQAAVGALAALAVLRAPERWRPAALALGVAAAFLAHESAWLALPGLALVAWRPELAAEREPPAAGARRSPLPVALCALAGAALGLAGAAWLRSAGMGAGTMSAGQLVARMRGGFDPALIWTAVLGPHLGLLALTAVALARGSRLLVLAAAGPYLAFALLVFGDPNAGGYVLPAAWALALAAARALDRLPRPGWIALALAVAQVALLAPVMTGPGQEAARAGREARAAAAAAALPRGGLVVVVDPSLQTIEGLVPGVHEINLWRELFNAVERGETPAEFARRIAPPVAAELARRPAVALDLSYRETLAARPDAVRVMDALTAELAGARAVEEGPAALLVIRGGG